MTYWVYENWMVNKARIHFGSCSFCKEGKGTNKQKEEDLHGTWHGPFDSYQAAHKLAKSTGRRVSNCGHCHLPARA